MEGQEEGAGSEAGSQQGLDNVEPVSRPRNIGHYLQDIGQLKGFFFFFFLKGFFSRGMNCSLGRPPWLPC